MAKVAFIGAGSFGFTRTLVKDILTFARLEDATLALMDIDEERLAFITRAVKRIVKEGRKYGIGAMVISQRPAEVDQTILSQCGTIFAMRLNNSTDRGHVSSALSDGMKGLLDMLPTLRTGEAIVVGEAVRLPTRALIKAPPKDRRPESEDPRVVAIEFARGESGPGGWDRSPEPPNYKDLVTVWRRQDPASPRIVQPEEES